MKFKEIIAAVNGKDIKGDTDAEISMITDDSRKCVPGSLFIAVKGYSSDGHEYIGKAIENGASAVIYQDPEYAPEGGANRPISLPAKDFTRL